MKQTSEILMNYARNRAIFTYLFSVFIMLSSGLGFAENRKSATETDVSDELLISKTDEIIKQYTDPGWFAGSLVIFKGDQVIYDKSFGLADIENSIKNTSATRTRIGSINKHFTAALVMQKVQAGKLSLDDNLQSFNLGFPKNIAEKITVRHLLKHTAGFADIFNNEYFRTYRSLKNITDKLPLLLDKPLISEPGKEFNYSNYGYIVLGAILEQLEQKSFQSIINDNILTVIKADNTIYDLTENVQNKAKSYQFSPLGSKIDMTGRLENLTPDGGMYSTPYDLALFYSKLLYSNQLLNDQSKAIMTSRYKKETKPWSELLTSDKTKWISYGGGPGVSAAVEVLVKDKFMVIALANTDDVVAERITQRVLEVYQGKQYRKVMLPLGIFATKLIAKKGNSYFIENAKREFSQAGYKKYTARPLNKLGFALMNDNQLDQAISVFVANTKIFPQEPNTFDSLANAYEKAGDNAKALLNYRAALALDSEFESAKEGILRLGK
jgi:CubicO group peptidase (beta-lactamase class C family)